MEKQAGFKIITRDIGMLSTYKFVAFSILLRTQTVLLNLEVSFIIYPALSTPSLLFAVHFVRTFETLAKTFHFLN